PTRRSSDLVRAAKGGDGTSVFRAVGIRIADEQVGRGVVPAETELSSVALRKNELGKSHCAINARVATFVNILITCSRRDAFESETARYIHRFKASEYISFP